MGASNRSGPKASNTFELTTGSVEETQALGERLGRLLRAGDVVALRGELGSGKTTLIQGLAQGLDIDPGIVKSPTFVLVREYNGPVPLVHIDGYRLDGPSAAAWLDVELLFSPAKIAVVEWAQRFEGLLPPDALALELEHVSANRRRIRLASAGARSREVMQGLEGTREDARD